MAVTTKDIARICGVSRGTVDRALNNRPNISPTTKERILKVAQELGYRPNMIARSLVKGRTMSLGVVVFDLYNQFFAQLVNALEQRARKHGYFTFVTFTGKNQMVEKECLIHLADRNVDGIIIFSVNKGEEFEEFLQSLNKPIITIGNVISEKWPFVGIDDRQGVKDAVKCIVKRGYKEIIYVCPPLRNRENTNMYALEERLSGYLEACQELGLGDKTNIIQQNDYCDALDQLLMQTKEKVAVLCSSDIYALEILMHLKKKNIRVPKDVGLMGFDNIDTLKYIITPLSTVAYPVETIANYAVDYLIRIIEGEKVPIRTYMAHTIIIRDSL